MLFHYPVGATPLDDDEIKGLIPLHVTTQKELNAWEQANILEAEDWAWNKKHTTCLTASFLQTLHRKMLGHTWRWAGKFRQSNKNIGVDWVTIALHLKNLLEDVSCQIAQNSYEWDEIAARFHHRLVWIHPFVNGNGRHARLMTDILLIHHQQPKFTWGANQCGLMDEVRRQYIHALRAADRYDYLPLLNFVRS